jgi:hypothetical protein
MRNKKMLWRWLMWVAAQHCVANKLKTSLGKPEALFLILKGDEKAVGILLLNLFPAAEFSRYNCPECYVGIFALRQPDKF